MAIFPFSILFARGSNSLAFCLFQIACGFLGRRAPDLYDLPFGPPPLMLPLTAIQVLRDAAMGDFLADLEVVLFPVSIRTL